MEKAIGIEDDVNVVNEGGEHSVNNVIRSDKKPFVLIRRKKN